MKGLARLNASSPTESERSWKSTRESKERGRVQDIWRDDRAVVKQQINTSILLALSFSAATVEKSADREEQIVWESRDQYGKQLPFDSPLSHNDLASISCWSSITCQWKTALRVSVWVHVCVCTFLWRSKLSEHILNCVSTCFIALVDYIWLQGLTCKTHAVEWQDLTE